MNVLALFAGNCGLELGLRLCAPVRIVCYVEQNENAVAGLKARIADGHLDDAPIWDDVQTFDGTPWAGLVDIVLGGFPCQDISCAGRRAGLAGRRSGLWFAMSRVIREVRPRYALVENVPGLLIRGMGEVLGCLAEGGHDAVWDCIPALALGAPHTRDRVFILAHATGHRHVFDVAGAAVAHTDSRPVFMADALGQGSSLHPTRPGCQGPAAWPPRWPVRPHIPRMDARIPHRLDRLERLGNSAVPAVVAEFLSSLRA